MWLTSCWHIKRLTQKPFPSELKPSPSAASFLKCLSLTLSPMLTIFITLLAQELLTPTASSYMTPTLPTPSLWWCHDHDIPPQPSHTYSCLLTVQTPPKHSLTKPKPIPGLPDSSIAFPKGCYTNICLVSIPKAVNTIPEHIQPIPNTSNHSWWIWNILNPINQPQACMLTSEPKDSVCTTTIGWSLNA